MSIKMRYLSTLLAAGAIAGVLSAPVAAASAPNKSCTTLGPYTTECSSPGSTSIVTKPNPKIGGHGFKYPVLADS